MKSCDDVLEELTARLADRAKKTEPLTPEVEEHLAACADCRREAEELARLWDGLGALQAEAPGAELRPRFDAMLLAYRAGMAGAEDGSEAPRAGRSETPSPRRRRSWLAALLGGGGGATGLRWAPAVAVALLVGLGLGTLLGARRGADVESLRAEVHSLNEMVALSLLAQPSAVERLRGVSYGGRVARPDRPVVAALVDTATADPNVNVRLAAVDALAPVASEASVQAALIHALPRQGSPMVQIAIADLLLASGSATARRAVGKFAGEPNVLPEVAKHLRQRLDRRVGSAV